MEYSVPVQSRDVDVKKCDECKTELSGNTREIPVLNSERVLYAMESNNFLEEVKVVVTDRRVGEMGDGCRSWPGDDGYEEDACDDCAFDFVREEDGSHETAAENTDPHHWRAHFG
jgi:hypothetical protein